MHLAVRNVDAFESCRPVRALLIKGADITIRDNRNKLPFDYVNEVQCREYAIELRKLLI